MKLGELRAAIRKSRAVPVVVTWIGNSPAMTLALQKMALLDALEKAFPEGKAAETGLTFDEATGQLMGEDEAPAPVAQVEVADILDL